MSNYHVIRTARLTDRQILQVIFAFKEEEQIENAIIGLGGNIQIDVATKERNEEDVAELDSDRHAIQSVTIVTSSAINISFHRGVSSNVQDPKASRQASPYFDELSLDPRRMEGYPESQQQFISCIDIIERALPRTVPLQEVDKGHTVIDVLQAEISGLADQYKAMLDGLAKEREEIRAAADEERQAARQAHDTAMKEAKAAAEEQKRQFDEYRKEQEAALAQRTNGLDERENDLDNRQHMHARRELREKISENFKERISKPVVSRTAKIMHWAVFVLTLGAGIYLGVQGLIDFNTLIETSSTEGFPGWLAAGWAFRSVVVLGVSIGFVAYAINWLRNVYLDDVRTRRQYERYGHDIDRASFVIETIMEVDGKEKTLVPDTWIEGVCRNLFRNNTDDTSDNPSANVAAMLLESISGAKIGPDGTEVSMDRRGVRRFAKKMPGG